MKKGTQTRLSVLLTLIMLLCVSAASASASDASSRAQTEDYSASGLTVVIAPVNGLEMNVGGFGNVNADVRGGSGSYYYEWSVGNGSLARISESGSGEYAMLAGLSAGSTTITVRVTDMTTNATGTDTIALTVKGSGQSGQTVAPLTVAITPANNLDVSVNDGATVSVDVCGGSGDYAYAWSVGNGNLATITGTGRGEGAYVSGRAAGSTTITVRVTDNATNATGTDTISLTVQNRYVASLTVSASPASLDMRAGDSQTLRANVGNGSGDYSYKWGVANGRVADFSGTTTARNVTVNAWASGSTSIIVRAIDNATGATGTDTIYVTVSDMTVSMEPEALKMAPNSSQSLSLTVTPKNASYRVTWTSSNSRIATVKGSGTSVTVTSQATAGSADIRAVVENTSTGESVTERCTVTVFDPSGAYSPAASAVLGSNLPCASLADGFVNQFRAVYNVTLPNTAPIQFPSVNESGYGANSPYGVMRRSNGAAISENVNYTLTDLRGMYFVPQAAGTFSLPYFIEYSNKNMRGIIHITVSSSQVNAAFAIRNEPYTFSSFALNTSVSGASILTASLNSAFSGVWDYVVFNASTSGTGTLYLNASLAAPGSGHINAAAMNNLHFVPVSTGIYDAGFTVYDSKGSQLGTGTLFITVSASVAINFTDVSADAYYYTAVQWAVERGVTNGYTPTIFGPADTCTRAQVATFLWRAEGTPEPKTTTNPFTDVDASSPFYKAILWAFENGITNGATATTFEPNGLCTYGHTITFLWRAKKMPAAGVNSALANANPGRYFTSAVAWADANQLLNGVGGPFNGDKACPRSDIVTYIYRSSQ